MNICFRADASLMIGSGHIMRCLALADVLRNNGAQCHFICRALPGHFGEKIEGKGHRLTLLTSGDDEPAAAKAPTHAHWLGSSWRVDAEQTAAALRDARPEWLVVDHYALDAVWERELRPHVVRIMAIDDLADRNHDADLLLDQNLGREERDYGDLVPQGCLLLIGPRYALLRPEFASLRDYSLTRRRNPSLRHIMISFGGVDAVNATGRVLTALQLTELPVECYLTVVMGAQSSSLDTVCEQATSSRWPCEVRVDVTAMAQLMAESDLAIGAAGSTSWERCCLGLPTLLIVAADNQLSTAHNLELAGGARLIGALDDIARNLPAKFASWTNPVSLAQMATAAANLCDGGGCARVLDRMALRGVSVAMESPLYRIRPISESDLEEVLRWRNHPDVSKHMFTQHTITPAEHKAWFDRNSQDRNRHMLVFEVDGRASGFVQFKTSGPKNTADWGFYIAPGAPPGTGRKLGQTALAYAFDTLRVRKLYGRALSSNGRSIAFHRALGFTEEGLPRDMHDDSYLHEAVVCFGLLAAKWYKAH